MATDKITRTAVTAQVRESVEAQLLAVKDAIAEQEGQIQELQATRSWLEGILTAAVGTGTAAPVAAPESLPAAAQREESADSSDSGEPPALKPEQPTPRRRAGASRQKTAVLTLPRRVEAFLRGTAGPQKIAEIAEALFGANVVPANVNMTRAAAERLVQRGAAEKSKQGSTVYYQAASDEAVASAG